MDDSIEITTVPRDEITGVATLLIPAVGDEGERLDRALERYRSDPSAILLRAVRRGEHVGAAGVIVAADRVTLLHIAVSEGARKRGVGRALVDEIAHVTGVNVPLHAETDRDGLGFYVATGFTVTGLGRHFPGVERYAVVRARDAG